jgi:hypothetical protein
LFADILIKIDYPDTNTGQSLVSLLPTFSGQLLDDDGISQYWSISYSPGRKDYVLQRLYDDNKITIQQAIKYMLTPIVFSPKLLQINQIKAPHFVQYIKESIINNDSLDINEQQLTR